MLIVEKYMMVGGKSFIAWSVSYDLGQSSHGAQWAADELFTSPTLKFFVRLECSLGRQLPRCLLAKWLKNNLTIF